MESYSNQSLTFDPARCKTPPFRHQVEGIHFLLQNPVALLADTMGTGKTKIIIDTTCTLWEAKEIDTIVVVCPASVRITWRNREDGELVRHCWVPHTIEEYSARCLRLAAPSPNELRWIVTNYEFIRGSDRLEQLMKQVRGRKLMVVFDESSFIKSHKAAQTKAAKKLRSLAKRAYLVNGSPITHSLMDLYAPFSVLDKSIIGSVNFWAYRNRYCVMGGYQQKQITGYQYVDELQAKLKPFVIRRLKEDCLDLPPKMYQTVEVAMCPETWRHYKEFRDEMITWLDSQTPMVTMNTVVKLVRLSQLTSGLAGGLARAQAMASMIGNLDFNPDQVEEQIMPADVRVISDEKHRWALNWFEERVEEQPNFRALFWTRFRREQEVLAEMFKGYEVHRIYGGQKKAEREQAIKSFNTASTKPMVLLGQPKAGGLGLNLQAECSWSVYVSNDYNLLDRLQSEDRVHRPGQKASVVNYLDILATGPNGQKTIDHAIRKALIKKDELAVKTTAYWRTALSEEDTQPF